jgi:hypothetical protein
MSKTVLSRRIKYLVHLLKRIEAKSAVLMGIFKQAQLVGKFTTFLGFLGKQ